MVIDDPLLVGECFFEKTLRFTKTELQASGDRSSTGGWQTTVQARSRLLRSRLGNQQFRRPASPKSIVLSFPARGW
jgi:hypothetical protein